MRTRIVITGMGAITPLGLSVAEFWDALLAGKSGIAPITLFDTTEYTTKIGGEVKGFDPEQYFEKKEIKKIDPFARFAIVAARQAVQQAAINLETVDRNRVGVIVGSGIGGMLSFEEEHTKLIEKGPDACGISRIS